jgi:magnesium-transporting ATPase (P-type)
LFIVPIQKEKHVLSFSFAYSVLLFSFLLFSGVWLLNTTNKVDYGALNEMITLINNVISVFMFVVISQVIIFQAKRMEDTGQVGNQYPHFLPE